MFYKIALNCFDVSSIFETSTTYTVHHLGSKVYKKKLFGNDIKCTVDIVIRCNHKFATIH